MLVENIGSMTLEELRVHWAEAWGRKPHARIGRTMLEKSLAFKIRERNGKGLGAEQQARQDKLVRDYKRSPACFEERGGALRPGSALSACTRAKSTASSSSPTGSSMAGRSIQA